MRNELHLRYSNFLLCHWELWAKRSHPNFMLPPHPQFSGPFLQAWPLSTGLQQWLLKDYTFHEQPLYIINEQTKKIPKTLKLICHNCFFLLTQFQEWDGEYYLLFFIGSLQHGLNHYIKVIGCHCSRSEEKISIHKNLICIFPPLPAPHSLPLWRNRHKNIQFCYLNSEGILSAVAYPPFIFAPYRSELVLLCGLEKVRV